ncbi:MAG TPA: thioesterase family protein [Gammaproteobacteria bacterium]|nr:thioesterase family protein [Gammaproteobacteria bacterium]
MSSDHQKNHPFSVVIPVRITDVNYGKHMAHTALIGILHQARVLFLTAHNLDELNIEGSGLILSNATYSYKTEAFFNTKLHIKVEIGEYSGARFNFLYDVTNFDTGKRIVIGKEEMAFFDYGKKKSVKIPETFLRICDACQTHIMC